MDLKYIRNFSIIAHIDHGKSTLADRFIQVCGGLDGREMEAQVLDSMDLERERGITIKAQSVMLKYHADDGETYQLNLIDTPGHVDFSYEVSRSLVACEGALLVVDAAQGVEAQSVANCYAAIKQEVEVIPVLNKIDLPSAEPNRVIKEIEDIIGIEARHALKISAKNGLGIKQVLEQIITQVPPPLGDKNKSLQALIIDSWFDNYLGVVSLIRIINGSIAYKQKITIMSTGRSFSVKQIGIFTPRRMECDVLSCGEVGFLVAGIKDIFGAPVGDTVTLADNPAPTPLDGFAKPQPKVFAGLYPINLDDYENLQKSLDKLHLNDMSLQFESETSKSLGFGFRCGFLGMLHMEIIQERLEREYNLELITTAPTVVYEVELNDGDVIKVDNPSKLPDTSFIKEIREPIINANILVPQEHLGSVMGLCVEKRGVQKNMQYLGGQIAICYQLPLSEVVLDFFDRLKSVSRGYASFDYEFDRFQATVLVRLDVLINGNRVDALSVIIHQEAIRIRGKALVEKMQTIIPRQMFEVAIQAAIGAKIIARSTIKALRKDVTSKLYGGDVTRKNKLLDKQREGKKRMKRVGKVDIPQDAFLAILRLDKR